MGYVTWQRPFQGHLSSVGWDVLCSTHIFSLKCLRLPSTKKSRAKPNVNIFVLSHPLGYLEVTYTVHHSIARWKARCRLPISDNDFFASSHGCGTIKRNLSKSAFSDGGGSL